MGGRRTRRVAMMAVSPGFGTQLPSVGRPEGQVTEQVGVAQGDGSVFDSLGVAGLSAERFRV